MTGFDAIIIGGGMAGASLAYHLAETMSVCIFEQESVAGYHATGRSAAFWNESYGGSLIQPLTSLSGPMLKNPPAEFSAHGFLRQRGALTIGSDAQRKAMQDEQAFFAARNVDMQTLSRESMMQYLPGVKPKYSIANYEPECSDIDVAALHNAYLTGAKKRGAVLRLGCGLESAERHTGQWQVRCGGEDFSAPLIVNASGAWADRVARCCGMEPLGITPLRRTVVQLRVSPPVADDMPLIIDALGNFYFKPESGRLWLSPHDETPSEPCDAAPEEWDVALAIERLQEVVDWSIDAVEHRWAGLRSFAPDRVPVYGFDAAQTGFYWFAGQGGYGIQTAPAAAQLAAHHIAGTKLPSAFSDFDDAPYRASRFLNQE
jgi:D-arginine dehydrogenase